MTTSPKLKKAKQSEPIPIWYDCDPGHDDALTLLMCANRNVRLLGVSTVHGNQTVEKTTANALKVLYVAGMQHVPVVSGAARPLVRAAMTCPEVHGDSGLDTDEPLPNIPEPSSLIVDEPACVAMNRIIANSDAKVTLLATGCLTNVALLVSVFPAVLLNVKEIVIMGGSIGYGNMTPAAEFNILVDPHAAQIVFDAAERHSVPLTMIPLDVTHTCLLTKARREQFEARGFSRTASGRFERTVIALLDFFAETYKKFFHFDNGPPLHDPVALFFILERDRFESDQYHVSVTLDGDSVGRTNVDLHHLQKRRSAHVRVATKVHLDSFFETLIHSLKECRPPPTFT